MPPLPGLAGSPKVRGVRPAVVLGLHRLAVQMRARTLPLARVRAGGGIFPAPATRYDRSRPGQFLFAAGAFTNGVVTPSPARRRTYDGCPQPHFRPNPLGGSGAIAASAGRERTARVISRSAVSAPAVRLCGRDARSRGPDGRLRPSPFAGRRPVSTPATRGCISTLSPSWWLPPIA